MKDQTIHTHTFANGLTLVVEPISDVQSAAFSLMIASGSVYDPPGQAGCASVLSDLITRGAGDRDSRELTDALDNLGVQRHEGADRKFISFGGAALAENLADALRIYADIVRRPHLPRDQFEAVLAGAAQTIQAIEDEPRQKVMLELRRRCYPAPWGLPSEGSLEGVENLTPDSLEKQYQRCFRPGEAILGIAGNVNFKAILDLVSELFGDWKAKPDPGIKLGERGAQRDHIPHESTQTQIGIAYESIPYQHPDPADAPDFSRHSTLSKLVKYEGVYMQLSGLKMFVPEEEHRLYPLIEKILEHFGEKRVYWGSNYPVVGDQEEYQKDLHRVHGGHLPIPKSAIADILGNNARALWFPEG